MRQTPRQAFIDQLNNDIRKIWDVHFKETAVNKAVQEKSNYECYLAEFNAVIDLYTYTIICEFYPAQPTPQTPILPDAKTNSTNEITTIEQYKKARDQLILNLRHQFLTKKSIEKVTTIFNETGAIVFSLIDEMPALQLDLTNNVKAQISHEDIALTIAQEKYYWETSPEKFEWRRKLNSVTQTIIEHLKPNRIKGTKLRIGPGLANPTQVKIENFVIDICAVIPSFHMEREILELHSDLNLKQWIKHINISRNPDHSGEQKSQGQGQDSRQQAPKPAVFMTFLSPAASFITAASCGYHGMQLFLEASILSTQQQSITNYNTVKNSFNITGINIPYDSFRLTPFVPTPNYQPILELLNPESSNLQREQREQKATFNSIYEKLQEATTSPIYYAKTIPLLIFILCSMRNISVKHNCKSNKDRGANFILTIFSLVILATKPDPGEAKNNQQDNVLQNCINYLASGDNTLWEINQALKTKRRELILDNTAATLSLHLGIAPKQKDIEYITWKYACLIVSSWLCCCPCALYEAPQQMNVTHVIPRCFSSITTALYSDNFSNELENKKIIQYPNLNKATVPAPPSHEMKR